MLGRSVFSQQTWTETRGQGVLKGEVVGVKTRMVQRPVVGKVLDASRRLLERVVL